MTVLRIEGTTVGNAHTRRITKRLIRDNNLTIRIGKGDFQDNVVQACKTCVAEVLELIKKYKGDAHGIHITIERE